MRFFLSLFVLIQFLSCTNSDTNTKKAASDPASSSITEDAQSGNTTSGEFEWLLGDWQRINNAKGKSTFEYWKKDKSGNYIGEGITLSGKDTTFQELMTFEKINEVWNLKVSGVNEQPTYFKFTVLLGNTFVCENPENEFPKKIIYRLDGDKLLATISADGQAMEFEFKKME